jgi:hypothetical protein
MAADPEIPSAPKRSIIAAPIPAPMRNATHIPQRILTFGSGGLRGSAAVVTNSVTNVYHILERDTTTFLGKSGVTVEIPLFTSLTDLIQDTSFVCRNDTDNNGLDAILGNLLSLIVQFVIREVSSVDLRDTILYERDTPEHGTNPAAYDVEFSTRFLEFIEHLRNAGI